MPEEELHVHKRRSLIATAVTLVVLLLVGLFVWRIVHYAQLIRTGDLALSDLSFLSEVTASERLKSVPLPDGEFDVVTEDDPMLGAVGAPVTIVEFADFGCPYSRSSSFVLRALAQKYGDKIHYVYRDFPVAELHPEAQKAAEAGECAREQGRFWEYHDKLYVNQNDLSESNLVQLARESNLNVRIFEQCLDSGKYAQEVQKDYEAGVNAGVRGTPTFFINGNRIPGAIPEDVLEALIQQVLTSEI